MRKIAYLAPLLIAGAVFLIANLPAQAAVDTQAAWIWSDADEPAPKNRFTYFRKVVDLKRIPEDATLRFAADSNARLWINGRLLRRKVSRYHEEKITAEVVQAGPHLRVGKNVIVVLHHNWGKMRTFQRTGNKHAGLWMDSDWLRTDAAWRWMIAPEFAAHETPILGLNGHQRVRYPQIVDGRKRLGDIHSPQYDDGRWQSAITVSDGPWPLRPNDVETPPQREYPVRPMNIVAAGTVKRGQPHSSDPKSISRGIQLAKCRPDAKASREAADLISGKPVTISGRAGQTHYLTVDFQRPVHGYPFLKLADAPAGTSIDFGYAEIWRSLFSGELHVNETGWLNPEGVTGTCYGDRYIATDGEQNTEIPDERTARWMTLHIHFVEDAEVVIDDLGIVKSQYPVDTIGSFSCGNEHIEQIIKLCLIHAEVTMTDAYVDTPGREDGQWLEDARPRALLAAAWFGDTKLRGFLIRTHAEGQGKDGHFHPFAPSNFPAYPAPLDWSVQWVAMLYDQYMWTADKQWITRYWPNLELYWKTVLSDVDRQGLWRTGSVLADIRTGTRPTKRSQSSGMVTPWIIQRLRWSAQMARVIGKEEQARQWTSTAQRMTEAFGKFHIVPQRDGTPAHVGDRYDPDDAKVARGYSQAGQTVAVYADLLTPAQARADLDYAFPEPNGTPPQGVVRWNNPTYCYRALRALSHVGLADRAGRHLIERYAPYLPAHPRNPTPLKLQGPYGGPLPEYWISREDLNLKPGKKNRAQPTDETGSHGWGAVPLLWMHDTLLGVRIVEPGGGKLRIAPQSAAFPFVAGHTVTPKGPVWVRWDNQQQQLEIIIPAGVSAEVVLPPQCEGKPIAVVESPGRVLQQQGRSLTIRGQGRYLFEVR